MKNFLKIALSLCSASVFAYGIGYTTHPMAENQKLISTEMTGIVSDNGGMGIQVRYTQKMNKLVSIDAGLGISGGDRDQRIFASVDYEIYPDYMRQPRFSLKSSIERADEFKTTNTVISVAPTLSKGFNFWGREAFPYVAVPFGLSLNSDKKSYETITSLNTGINGQVPVDGFNHLNANLELQIGLQDSFTAMLVGLSFPMN